MVKWWRTTDGDLEGKEAKSKTDDDANALMMAARAAMVSAKSSYLRMRVAPLRLMRHMEEQAMSYMIKVLRFLAAGSSLGIQKTIFT